MTLCDWPLTGTLPFPLWWLHTFHLLYLLFCVYITTKQVLERNHSLPVSRCYLIGQEAHWSIDPSETAAQNAGFPVRSCQQHRGRIHTEVSSCSSKVIQWVNSWAHTSPKEPLTSVLTSSLCPRKTCIYSNWLLHYLLHMGNAFQLK